MYCPYVKCCCFFCTVWSTVNAPVQLFCTVCPYVNCVFFCVFFFCTVWSTVNAPVQFFCTVCPYVNCLLFFCTVCPYVNCCCFFCTDCPYVNCLLSIIYFTSLHLHMINRMDVYEYMVCCPSRGLRARNFGPNPECPPHRFRTEIFVSAEKQR